MKGFHAEAIHDLCGRFFRLQIAFGIPIAPPVPGAPLPPHPCWAGELSPDDPALTVAVWAVQEDTHEQYRPECQDFSIPWLHSVASHGFAYMDPTMNDWWMV